MYDKIVFLADILIDEQDVSMLIFYSIYKPMKSMPAINQISRINI